MLYITGLFLALLAGWQQTSYKLLMLSGACNLHVIMYCGNKNILV